MSPGTLAKVEVLAEWVSEQVRRKTMNSRLFMIGTAVYYATFLLKALIWIPLFGGGFAAHNVEVLLGWTGVSATVIYLVTVSVTTLVWRFYDAKLVKLSEEVDWQRADPTPAAFARQDEIAGDKAQRHHYAIAVDGDRSEV